MRGPEHEDDAPPPAQSPVLPGEFTSPELESDTARFLEAVKTLVRRREERLERGGLDPDE